MEVGSRVAYILSEKARCGVIISDKGGHYKLKLDDGKTIIDIQNSNRLYQIDYWLDAKREIDASKLKLLPNDIPCLEIFSRRKPITFGIAAVRAMWYWGNKHVFDNKLIEPDFKIYRNKKQWGLFKNHYITKSKPIIYISERHVSFKDTFTTVLHESIHQMNFEYELSTGEFNPREGAHGQGFLRWIPIVKAKSGIQVTVQVNVNETDADFNNNNKNEELKTKPFIFAVANLVTNKTGKCYYGFTVSNKEELEDLASRLRQVARENNGNPRIYAGICNLARVKKEFKPAPKGNISSFKIGGNIVPSLMDLLKNNYTPIDGFYGPDKV